MKASHIVVAIIAAAAMAGSGLLTASKALARTYTVPKSIKADCSVAVEAKVMAWLKTVPDGSTVNFGVGRCYGQDGTITLTDRNRLVIDGRGSEFRALTPGDSHRANWRFLRGSNLTVRNMAVRGSNPEGRYQAGFEWQHGYSVDGVQGMTLSNVKARETWGDGVYLYKGVASRHVCGEDAPSARNVLITGALLERIGRQGVAVVDAEQVKLQDSTVGPVALLNVDIETNEACQIARHITVERNSFGANGWGVIANPGPGADPQVGDVSVIDNVQTELTVDTDGDGCYPPPVWTSSTSAGVYRDDFNFSGNQLVTHGYAFALYGLRNVDVSSNSVNVTPPTGCQPLAGVQLIDSHTVSISGNIFSGENTVFEADNLSTGITTANNTLD